MCHNDEQKVKNKFDKIKIQKNIIFKDSVTQYFWLWCKSIFLIYTKRSFPEILTINCKMSCCKADSSIKMQNKQVSYFGTNWVHQRYEVMWKEGKFSVVFSQQGCEKNPFWILAIYVPVMYLCSSRFLVDRKQDALIMRNRGPEAAVCHSTWKASKIC